jgi:hypothetical protein
VAHHRAQQLSQVANGTAYMMQQGFMNFINSLLVVARVHFRWSLVMPDDS